MLTGKECGNLEERIVEAAKSLFMEKGYAGTSMSDIAAKVGINRPVLHYYFRTKDRMFQAVFGDIFSAIVPQVFGIMLQKERPITERIAELVDAYYALFWAHPRLPMFVLREMNRDADLLIRTATRLAMPERLRAVLDSLREEMDEGKLRRIPLRVLFYNLYGLLTIPFLTQDISRAVLSEADESFREVLEEWKPYVVSQLGHLLAV